MFIVVIQQDDLAKTLLHPEVPKYYTWNTSRKCSAKDNKEPELQVMMIYVPQMLWDGTCVHTTNYSYTKRYAF
jgi:hypothetical protein